MHVLRHGVGGGVGGGGGGGIGVGVIAKCGGMGKWYASSKTGCRSRLDQVCSKNLKQ